MASAPKKAADWAALNEQTWRSAVCKRHAEFDLDVAESSWRAAGAVIELILRGRLSFDWS